MENKSNKITYDVKLLEKNLQKYIRVMTGNRYKNHVLAVANCYRKLLKFQNKLIQELKSLGKELIEANAEFYFREDLEKLTIQSFKDPLDGTVTKYVSISKITSNKDKKKAIKQDLRS